MPSHTAAAPATAQHRAPYVGPRPYERSERDIFFGRDRDAGFLCDKIFSARLTLLYAQSGIGKSSLLRTLVVPLLEKENAIAVYFDDWTGEDPLAALRSVLVRTATEHKVPDAGAGAPTLSELAALLTTVESRTVVLILDQFEELLVKHGQQLDPLRRELAALVRMRGIDARVVVSLRQEFLAALEPFRPEIPNLFQSTYLLDSLDDGGVREAIESPAKTFGIQYEPELVDRLMSDLRPGEEGAAVDLPTMQLVCGQLWEAARKRAAVILGMALYQELGGARRILDDYVRGVMPRGWWDRYVAARLMVSLAPPSGLKMSFAADDLAAITGLDAKRVTAQLERLGRHRILRTRGFRGKERFELQHDALVKVVGPWRDKVLHRARVLLWAGTAVCALLGVLLAITISDRWELSRNTTASLAELGRMKPEDRAHLAESRFDAATSYLLYRKHGPNRLDALKDLLQRDENLLPANYGFKRIVEAGTPLEPAGQSRTNTGARTPRVPQYSTLTVRYSSSRELNEEYFADTWQMWARFVVQTWGIPASERVWLIRDSGLPKQVLRVEGSGGQGSFDVRIPAYEKMFIISSKNLPDPADEFLKRFPSEWKPIPEVTDGGPWWVVPRWSLPVWKVSGQMAIEGSGYPVFVLASELLKRPEFLLPKEQVDRLLDGFGGLYPQTRAEAVAARGDRIQQDLIEVVRLGRPLVAFPSILDALASSPRESSKDAAVKVDADLRHAGTSSKFELKGPWPPTTLPAKSSSGFRPIVLPVPARPPFRLRWGRGFAPQHKALVASFDSLSDEFFGRFGIDLPPIGSTASLDPTLPENGFRIETDHDSETIVAKSGADPDALSKALKLHIEAWLSDWITAETVNSLRDDLDAHVRDWLERRYSLTDLKLLLRAVVTPGDTSNQGAAIAPRQTIRDADWLLGSLVFWSVVDGPRAGTAIARHLQDTQAARLDGVPAKPGAGAVPGDVVKGIRALDAGRPAEAESAFASAAKADREGAIRGFLATYPASLRSLMARRSDTLLGGTPEQFVTRIDNEFATRTEWTGLEEMLGEADAQPDRERARRLRLWLFAAYPDYQREKRNAVLLDLRQRSGSPDEWPAPEAAWFALRVLKNFNSITGSPEVRQSAEEFLKSAVRRLDSKSSLDVLYKTENIASNPGPRNWCWALLDSLAEIRPDPYFLADLSLKLAERDRNQDFRKALELTRRLNDDPNASSDAREWGSLARGAALFRLSAAGGTDVSEAREIFQRLIASKRKEIAQSSRVYLAELQMDQGRYDEAIRIAKIEESSDKPDPAIYTIELLAALLSGDRSAAVDTAARAHRAAGAEVDSERAADSLFPAALGEILLETGSWEETGRRFLETNHAYVPYIAMILYSHTARNAALREDALELIQRRWEGADPRHWTERLRAGDETAWREMLIGYYLKKVDRREIFGKLDDDAAYKSSDLRFVPLGRRGMLCEAYFYDALLADANQDPGRRDESLRRVLKTGMQAYTEYSVAKFLLASDNKPH